MEEIKQIVTFKVGKTEFGVNILDVQEIIRLPEKITKLPLSEDKMRGIIDLRGKVVPIVDMRNLFDEEYLDDKHQRIIISQNVIGFVVDSVEEVLTLEKNMIEEVDNSINQSEHTKALVKFNDRLIVILDLKSL